MSKYEVVQDKYLCTEWKLIKIHVIQIFKIDCPSKACFSPQNPHYLVPFLVFKCVGIYFYSEKEMQEKSLNKLSLAADLLKLFG